VKEHLFSVWVTEEISGESLYFPGEDRCPVLDGKAPDLHKANCKHGNSSSLAQSSCELQSSQCIDQD
ncbi:hypothetical protein Ancab_036705, partial [Ancistrocladus abbreviatus]